MIGNSSESVGYSLSESARRALRVAAVERVRRSQAARLSAAVERVRRSQAARLSSNRRTDGPQPGEVTCCVACRGERPPASVQIRDTSAPGPAETGRGVWPGKSLA